MKKIVVTGKKDGLSWGLYAFCLEKLGRTDEAIKILEEGNKTLKELVEALEESVGTMYYRRVDLRLTPEQKDAFVAAKDVLRPKSVAGFEVLCHLVGVRPDAGVHGRHHLQLAV